VLTKRRYDCARRALAHSESTTTFTGPRFRFSSPSAFPRHEMRANSDTTFWTDLGYNRASTLSPLQDYKNWLASCTKSRANQRAEWMRCRRDEASVTLPKSRWKVATPSIKQRSPTQTPEGQPVLHTIQRHARGCQPRSGQKCERRRHDHSRFVQPVYGELLKFMRTNTFRAAVRRCRKDLRMVPSSTARRSASSQHRHGSG